MPVFVGGGCAGQEALDVTYGGPQNRMARSKSCVEDDDPWSIFGRAGHLLQMLNVRKDEFPLQPDTWR